MIQGEAFDSVHITSVENGRNTRDSLPSADGAGGQSTVARNVRRVPGCTIGTGVFRPLNE
jgi:hypothetical protein